MQNLKNLNFKILPSPGGDRGEWMMDWERLPRINAVDASENEAAFGGVG